MLKFVQTIVPGMVTVLPMVIVLVYRDTAGTIVLRVLAWTIATSTVSVLIRGASVIWGIKVMRAPTDCAVRSVFTANVCRMNVSAMTIIKVATAKCKPAMDPKRATTVAHAR